MDIRPGRWSAEVEGDFVVFLIGAAIHDPDRAAESAGLLVAMLDMLGELEEEPELGLMGFAAYGEGLGGVIVQYWRSFEALESYARNPSARHAPVWRAWNRLAGDDRGASGIWHETFKVSAGDYEAVYQNMPVMGLQRAGRPVTVSEARDSARQRLGGSAQ